jgi:hypothetical protein
MVKIGRSINGGALRARQMYQTGVPQPFVLEFEMLAKDCEQAESDVHAGLSEYRVSGSREFFTVDVDVAVQSVAISCLFQINWTAIPIELDDAISNVGEIASRVGAHVIEMIDAIQYLSTDAAEDCYAIWRAKQRQILADISDAKRKAH